MKRILHFFLGMMLIQSISFAQLSGTYTIGGSSPDYTYISQAAYSLHNLGISGPVTFNIRPGVYYEEVDFEPVAGSSITNRITFQSENLDSSSVQLLDTFGTSAITMTNFYGFYIFRELTISCNAQNTLAYLRNVNIENCVISGPVNPVVSLDFGTDTIINSIVNGNIDGFNAPLFFKGNILNGELSMQQTTCLNNIVYGKLDCTGGPMENNEVHGYISYRGASLKNNKIFKPLIGKGKVDVGYSGGINITGNIFHVPLDVGFTNNCKFIGNKVFDYTDFSQSDFALITNNFIYDTVNIGICHHSNIINNSFSLNSSALLTGGCIDFNIENNILPGDVHMYGDSAITIFNNDYPSFAGNNDLFPWHIDPGYKSLYNLHSKNNQLSGIGKHSALVYYDIDSIIRSDPPSIGACEICISSDTISIYCGDSIILSFCNLPVAGNYIWHPVTGLNDPTKARPKIALNASSWYFIKDSVTGYSDSVYLKLIPFQNHNYSDTIINCGDSIMLNATYNGGATFQWSPFYGLNYPDSISTMASPSQTTIYTCNILISGCPVSIDTIKIRVDSLPRAFGQYTYSGFTINLQNESTCATSYLWFFGDGDSSTDINPQHTYTICGTYQLTLIACNNYGCDTIYGSFYACNIGIDENDNYQKLEIYPNPSLGKISIHFDMEENTSSAELGLMNVSGEELFHENISIENNKLVTDLNLEKYQNGIYYLAIRYGNKFISRKITVIK